MGGNVASSAECQDQSETTVVGSFRMVLGTNREARIMIFNNNAFGYHIHTFKDFHINTFFALSKSETMKILPIFSFSHKYHIYSIIQYNIIQCHILLCFNHILNQFALLGYDIVKILPSSAQAQAGLSWLYSQLIQLPTQLSSS